MNDRSRLGPEQRRAALSRLENEVFDVVVIGGGATGTGAALDAATRGLNVALVEARDFASGTSSRSSKLVHGGLRYLEQKDFGLVREALRERGLLLNMLAPHLVTPVPFLLPLTEHWQRAYIGAGLVLYDNLGGHGGLPRATAPEQTWRVADRTGAEVGRARRRDPVLRRQGRRRPSHDDRRPHRRRDGRRGALQHARGRLPARRRAGHRRARPRRGLRQGVRRALAGGRQRHGRVDRRPPGPRRRARQVQGARLQGHSPRGPAGPRSSSTPA